MEEFELKPTIKGVDFDEASVQIGHSSGLESLISQNEDLAARLRVAIRSIASLENQNKDLAESYDQLRIRLAATQDQLLIWREKESIWQERIQKSEDQTSELKKRFPELLSMEEKLDRYRRYHERVKTQVKPYIHELKQYSEGLLVQIQELNQKLDQSQSDKQTLSHKISDLENRLDKTLASHHQVQVDLMESFEKDRIHLQNEIESLKELNSYLQNRSDRLDKSLSKQDNLENEVVAVRRKLDELHRTHESEISSLRQQYSSERQKLVERNLQAEEQQKEIEKLSAKNLELEKQRLQQDEQMTSLRYLWTARSEECEKLNLANQALEKLNAELSHKLNELKKGEI